MSIFPLHSENYTFQVFCNHLHVLSTFFRLNMSRQPQKQKHEKKPDVELDSVGFFKFQFVWFCRKLLFVR